MSTSSAESMAVPTRPKCGHRGPTYRATRTHLRAALAALWSAGDPHLGLQMRSFQACLVVAALLACSSALAGEPFSGEWEIDLRTPVERGAGVDCGAAGFKLVQAGDTITGTHWMITAGCGRQNEGGDGTVVGVVRGGVATLTVTSARNGEVVRGRARREGTNLRWRVLEELNLGEPEADSGLILHQGLLRRVER